MLTIFSTLLLHMLRLLQSTPALHFYRIICHALVLYFLHVIVRYCNDMLAQALHQLGMWSNHPFHLRVEEEELDLT